MGTQRQLGVGRPWVGLLSAVLALALAAGCEMLQGNSESSPGGQRPAVSPVQHPLLENIPLPLGFRMVRERSNAWKSGQIRWANCEFEGGTTPEQTRTFYTGYMPSAKFTLKQERLENGIFYLRFESDAEECNVRIQQDKSKTTLVINIGPLPKGSAEVKSEPPGFSP